MLNLKIAMNRLAPATSKLGNAAPMFEALML